MDTLRQKLIAAARAGRTLHYEDIAPDLGLNLDLEADRAECGRLLGEVSKSEVAAGRPMLSAIVVHKGGDEIPGDGFFKLAREMGRFSGGDRTIYFAMEFKEVCEYWRFATEAG
jgi:hypothetical protein